MLSLTKRNNRTPSLFEDVFGEQDSWFADIFGKQFVSASNPNIDILDQKDKLVFNADLPGLTKEDIAVSVDQGVLTIKGERKQETSSEKDGVLHREVSYGSFSRSFRLDYSVSNEEIKATYKNGVLRVEVPKREQQKALTTSVKIE